MASQTILHVEDDVDMAEAIRYSFEHCGFRGTILTAGTVEEAGKLLDDAARSGRAIDMIISDMSLPDGSGLDVLRRVRRNPVWEKTPILMLSADTNREKVGLAYDLGATNYLSKSPRGRSLLEVIRTLYDHWMKDAVLPEARPPDRTHEIFSREVKLRGRHAAFYVRMAEQFDQLPSEVAFWMSRALIEANLANLIMFLERQLHGRELPAAPLDAIEKSQVEADLALAAIEREIETHPITTLAEAHRRLLELITLFDAQRYGPMLRYLMRVAPRATEALRDVIARLFEDLADWVDSHGDEPALSGKSTSLRGTAAYLRKLPAE